MLFQALPASLQALTTMRVTLEALAQLTALDWLKLRHPKYHAGSLCSVSALQRLTHLQLSNAGDVELHAFAGLPAIRELILDSAFA